MAGGLRHFPIEFLTWSYRLINPWFSARRAVRPNSSTSSPASPTRSATAAAGGSTSGSPRRCAGRGCTWSRSSWPTASGRSRSRRRRPGPRPGPPAVRRRALAQGEPAQHRRLAAAGGLALPRLDRRRHRVPQPRLGRRDGRAPAAVRRAAAVQRRARPRPRLPGAGLPEAQDRLHVRLVAQAAGVQALRRRQLAPGLRLGDPTARRSTRWAGWSTSRSWARPTATWRWAWSARPSCRCRAASPGLPRPGAGLAGAGRGPRPPQRQLRAGADHPLVARQEEGPWLPGPLAGADPLALRPGDRHPPRLDEGRPGALGTPPVASASSTCATTCGAT